MKANKVLISLLVLFNCTCMVYAEERYYLTLSEYDVKNSQLDSIMNAYTENASDFHPEPHSWNYAIYIDSSDSISRIIISILEDVYIEQIPIGVINKQWCAFYIFADKCDINIKKLFAKTQKKIKCNKFYKFTDDMIKLQTSYGYYWTIVYDGIKMVVANKYCSRYDE